MLSISRRLLHALVITALLAGNVLTLTWEAFALSASALLSAAGIPTLQTKRALAAQQKRLLVKKTTASVRKRTLKSAAVNVASMAGEAVPYVGIAVIAGATAYELKLACDNLLELDSLHLSFGFEVDEDRSNIEKVCNPNLAEGAAELREWGRTFIDTQEPINNDPRP